MKTLITQLKIPLDLKERIKKQAENEGLTLSAWIFKELELSLDVEEYHNKYL